jgi:predicted metal-dependent hydrolase
VSDRQLVVGTSTYDVTIARHRRARRYVLRVDPAGALRLTVPRGASISEGLRFAARQADWIARERARQQARAVPWTATTEIWFRGERVPAGDLTEASLAALAARELPARVMELAEQQGVQIARVSVRNQRSRWGACSPRRAITLNWRLIQMPPSVVDYIIFHELAHLRHANHSHRFWREVERMCAWWRDAERWLRRHGREIL